MYKAQVKKKSKFTKFILEVKVQLDCLFPSSQAQRKSVVVL